MNTKQAYNLWSSQYDTNENKTRDLESLALRKTLAGIDFETCLEIGCGTGKIHHGWLRKQKQITAVDLSEEMLSKAKEKVTSGNVEFIQADITDKWTFRTSLYDLVTFSLVLEHIQFLDPVFREVSQSLAPGGYVYVGELHPFKQYNGTKARFETAEGIQVVECFNHHLSDFTSAAIKNGFSLVNVDEYFDDNDKSVGPENFVIAVEEGLKYERFCRRSTVDSQPYSKQLIYATAH